MSANLVIVENISKKFCRSLKRSLWYGMKDLGAELSGHENSHRDLRNEEFWAVRNVTLKVNRGETLGLIGHNGAGKTTLLRMLNGLIKPDTGHIEIRGRMQALIALGAGFNPILTGRENVYVNAAVLGIPKKEVDRRFDEIIDFSGIEKFIDTPVQSYSSGMAVRLGFAIAAHMDPDILLVDEVLAVGDLAFQAKCRERIQSLMQRGVSIILVSHNLHTISHTCSRVVVFENGQVICDGETEPAIDVYRDSLIKQKEINSFRAGTGEIKITRFEILGESGVPQEEFNVGDSVKLRLHYSTVEPVYNPVFNVGIHSYYGQVTGFRPDVDGIQLGTFVGDGYVDIDISQLNLLPNVYTINVTVFHTDGYAFYDRIERISHLKIMGGHQLNGVVHLPHSWYCSRSQERLSQFPSSGGSKEPTNGTKLVKSK